LIFSDLTSIPVIDAHMHIFPPKLYDAVRRWFEANAWKFHENGAAEDFIQAQFAHGAAGLVVMPYAHRPHISQDINEFAGALVRRFPHTAGLAAVHPADQNPRDILKRAFEECGLCGVKLHCHVLAIPPDDPAMFPIYETVAEYDGIINIHAGREPAIEEYGLDVRAISGADRVENILRRHPELKMIIPHLGIDETDRFYALMETYPNLYLDTAMVLGGFFPVQTSKEELRGHSDRILYGTDYPHIPYEMEWELKAILNMDLGETALRRILFENAARLFPLGLE
jgi:predicted TIM-barrel fold metal-dependent hydrolase